MLNGTSQVVGLGLIGLGWWGGELADAAARGGESRVVSCFARNEEARQDFAARHDCRSAESLDSLLADPEVEGVLIATSHQSHRDLVEQTAAAGKHIFVEKPLTTTVADGRACVEAAASASVHLQVGHQRRRTSANRLMKTMIEAGDIGDIETIVAQQSVPNGFKMPETAWRWSPEQSPLGSMTSLGVHKIDTMHYLAGRITRVFAMTRPGRSHPIDEATVLSLEIESGALATLTTSFFTPVVNEIAVFGTDGALYNTDAGRTLSRQARGDSSPAPVQLEEIDPVVDEILGFARAVRGEGPVEPDGLEGLAVVAVLEAAVESSVTGRVVDVAPV